MKNNIIQFEGARILEIGSFKNFEGREVVSKKTNRVVNNVGDRYFTLVIDSEEQALEMINEGWNVGKYVFPDPEKGVQYHVPVAVSYKIPRLAPDIYIVEPGMNGGEDRITKLSEKTVGILDRRDIEKVDGAIRGREWEPGRIKAYCVELWCTVKPRSRFAEKYGYIETYNVEDEENEESPF
jgi:hypothetical protein